MLSDMTPPEVGIHHAVPFPDYLAWPLVNSSAVKAGMQSMLHMHAEIDKLCADVDTKDRRKGRAIHCRLLEPDRYALRFPVAEYCCGLKADGDVCGKNSKYMAAGKWYCGTHKPSGTPEARDYFSPSEGVEIDGVVDAVQRHKAIGLLRSHGGCEVSAIGELFGVRIKIRIDKHLPPGGSCPPSIIDLKKCRTASKEACEKAILNYKYYIQGAVYKGVADELLGCSHRVVFVFIEDTFPHDVCCIFMDDESLAIGRHEVRLVLEQWKDAEADGVYPGGSESIEVGGLPEFYRRRYANWTFEEPKDDRTTTDDAVEPAILF